MKYIGKYLGAWMVPVLFAVALQGVASAAEAPVNCFTDFKKALQTIQGDAALGVLENTGSTPLGDYFKETETYSPGRGQAEVQTRYTPENVQKFMSDVIALVAAKTNTTDFPIEKFQGWLNTDCGGVIPLPDPFVMRNLLIRNNATLNDFVDKLVLTFLRDTQKELPRGLYARLSRRFKDALDFKKDPVSARLWRAVKLVAIPVTSFLYFTIRYQLQSPIAGLVSVPLGPVNDYSGRLGTRYLSGSASAINDLINRLDNPDVPSAKNRLQDAHKNEAQMLLLADQLGKYQFNGLSPQKDKQVWDAFEKRFFDLMQRVGKLLNQDEAGGRDIYLNRRLQMPEGFALSLTSIRTNIEVTRLSMDRLTEKIRQNADHRPTPEQDAQLREYENLLENDKRQMAVVLTDWMLSRFFYPEIANASELDNSDSSDSNLAFRSIDQYLGFPEFAAQLKSEIGITLSVIDGRLKALEQAIGPNAAKP